MGRFTKAIAAGIGAPLTLVASYLVFAALDWAPVVTPDELQGAVGQIIALLVSTSLGTGAAVYRAPKNAESKNAQ